MLLISFNNNINFAKNLKLIILRKKNSICEFIPMRDANLRREYKALLGHGHYNTSGIFKALASVGADRFYISEERAYHLLTGPARRKRPLPNKAAMMAEIERRVMALVAEDPGLSLKDAVCTVVNSPAPSFYLTPSSIKTILYK